MTVTARHTNELFRPQTVADLQQWVQSHERVWICGGRTKPALSNSANVSLQALSGLVDYHPQEFTFTAWAGTPIQQLSATLAAQGQFLPFDPVLVDAGSTLGGTIASGLSGSGRFRYGGIRDFILAVRVVTGTGEVVFGGGKVVKNAAGFDIPKLMVGSLGRLGVIVEATFKVFPQPARTATLRADYPTMNEALEDYYRLGQLPLDLLCLDYEPPGRIWLRIGGLPDALAARLARCHQMLHGRVEIVEEDLEIWRQVRELTFFASAAGVARVAITPQEIPRWEEAAQGAGWQPRRYAVGGHALWLGIADEQGWANLQQQLEAWHRSATAVAGYPPHGLLGELPGGAFAQRLAQVFDPLHKFRPPWPHEF